MSETISEAAPVFDIEKAIENLGDDALFNELVNKYDETLIKTLDNLKTAMDNFDYREIRMKSHSLKGPSSYIQGERVRRAAEIVQQNIDNRQGPNAYQNYALLMTECIRLRRQIRVYCSKRDRIILTLCDNFLARQVLCRRRPRLFAPTQPVLQDRAPFVHRL